VTAGHRHAWLGSRERLQRPRCVLYVTPKAGGRRPHRIEHRCRAWHHIPNSGVVRLRSTGSGRTASRTPLLAPDARHTLGILVWRESDGWPRRFRPGLRHHRQRAPSTHHAPLPQELRARPVSIATSIGRNRHPRACLWPGRIRSLATPATPESLVSPSLPTRRCPYRSRRVARRREDVGRSVPEPGRLQPPPR